MIDHNDLPLVARTRLWLAGKRMALATSTVMAVSPGLTMEKRYTQLVTKAVTAITGR
jgi:hypothetical protein